MYREDQLRALLEGRRILIAGYGREGKSAERLIQRLVPEANYVVADGNEQIATEATKDYDLIIKSPGVPMRVLTSSSPKLGEGDRRSAVVEECVTSLTDLFLQVYGDLTIGITGTKGKSTTASLIHHLLPGSILAGNIGIPLFDILNDLREDSIVVAELSCHQLENIHRAPHIAVLLNLFQEHLDHYDNYMGYKMAKMQIALKQHEGDHFFYCTDNAELCDMVRNLKSGINSCLHPYTIQDVSDEERQLLEAFPLEGEHNKSNALVACRVACYTLLSQWQAAASSPGLGEQLKVTSSSPKLGEGDRREAVVEECAKLLATFKGLRHRMEKVGCYKGITWYDDSISTIPEAAIAAVKALGRVDTLILGGFDRGIDYTPLVDFLNEHPINNLVFVGAAGRRIYQQLSTFLPALQALSTVESKNNPAKNFQLSTLIEDDYTKIVPWCAGHTPQGGVVLLSPAAASYDAFKNFEHRGDFYREQIIKLNQN
ncbi:MAG: UDP-N-acetylmuramoyl-L-alanine--D-glutamate ligase [Bacteroidales bacterium]|nr:UDP-N-acetylmuramoyl-L-alanine--D-glutamate ligase [Bacteroidales bacterium]